MKQPHKLIQSYIKNKFFISTAYRRCSAALAPDLWYYETIVWEWDKKTGGVVGAMLETADSGISETYALENHFALCEKYSDGGVL